MSRGPESLKTMLFFHEHVQKGVAYMIDSNHGWKIARWLDGRDVTLNHGDEKVEEEFKGYEEEYGSEKAAETKNKTKRVSSACPFALCVHQEWCANRDLCHAGIKDNSSGNILRP